jgi:hypothetical protein
MTHKQLSHQLILQNIFPLCNTADPFDMKNKLILDTAYSLLHLKVQCLNGQM